MTPSMAAPNPNPADVPTETLQRLRITLLRAAEGLVDEGLPAAPSFERPPKSTMGDYSSNAAMILAGRLKQNPRQVAEQLVAALAGGDRAGEIERSEVAGPGFVNLFMADGWYLDAVAALVGAGSAGADVDPLRGLGPAAVADPLRILVEFVSANPTGPLTAASGRHAAYGDSLCRLLSSLGHQVEREYYVNDGGGQIERFAASIAAATKGEPPPEDGYGGDYIAGLAQTLAGRAEADGGPVDPDDLEAVGRAGVALMLEGIRATMDTYGVEFDRWTSERELYERGAVDAALEKLGEAGRTYEADGALWLRTSELGDDKDRVLVRAGGPPTYFAADVAYHAEKLDRGYQLLIDVLGADHHGYIGRMRAAVEALGAAPEVFEAPIMQMVNIVEGGERKRMSKRRGDIVTLDELIADIGVDATRFFMLQRSHETPFDLDLDLARSQSSENPVYYVQYAHARIASILRKAEEETGESAAEADIAARFRQSLASTGSDREPLHPSERELVKRLLELPDEIREAADRRAPHRICAYAMEIAADFHGFYRDCQVIGAAGEGVEDFRLALCVASKRTLAATLWLLGIAAPERM